jgi:hypothetical protein
LPATCEGQVQALLPAEWFLLGWIRLFGRRGIGKGAMAKSDSWQFSNSPDIRGDIPNPGETGLLSSSVTRISEMSCGINWPLVGGSNSVAISCHL